MVTESHVVMFSGGVGSWATAKRVAERYGTDDLQLVFADTKMEDPDLYRFLREAGANVGGKQVVLAEGRNPWQVFNDVRFLGNSRVDPCSKILKRQLIRTWLNEHHDPRHTVVYLGYDWTEVHRQDKAARFWSPWVVESPMTEPPLRSKEEMLDGLRAAGIAPPALYELGFPHNNCGGFCIKAGQAHFKLLLETMPERYAFHERMEQGIREMLGKDVAIMKDRRGGDLKPLTMEHFRLRLQGGGDCDVDDWGGCGCFAEPEDG